MMPLMLFPFEMIERFSITTANQKEGANEKSKGAIHLAKKSGNFGLKSNGKVIFRKIRSERNVGNFLTICFNFPFPGPFKDLRAVLVDSSIWHLIINAGLVCSPRQQWKIC